MEYELQKNWVVQEMIDLTRSAIFDGRASKGDLGKQVISYDDDSA